MTQNVLKVGERFRVESKIMSYKCKLRGKLGGRAAPTFTQSYKIWVENF